MSNDPPRSNANANPPQQQHHHHASSSYAGRPTAQQDLTWLDFLRSAGGTVRDDRRPPQLNRTESAERKRRHTGSEPQRRSYPHPYPAYTSRHQDHHHYSLTPTTSRPRAGSTMADAIDLTTPPRVPRPPGPGVSLIAGIVAEQRAREQAEAQRRESDALPRWQPDHEATECPVCKHEFTFLNRRHHCRKCGRVVCANCSPHRITIPNEYIVQPPTPSINDEANPASPSGRRGHQTPSGGETVRVCNPCVPDPWTPNANNAVNTASAAQAASATNAHHQRQALGPPTAARSRNGHVGYIPERVSRQQNHHGRPDSSLGDWQQADPMGLQAASRSVDTDSSAYDISPARLSRQMRHGYRNGQLYPSNPPRRYDRPPPPMFPMSAPPGESWATPSPDTPQREVREEDECPVCGIEMAPGEASREAHIEACIQSHMSSTPAQQSRSAPPATDAVAPAPPRDVSSNAAEGSRPRAMSHRPRGMALYRATEKDCVDEFGFAQECTICFEEFEEGDEMGRMECLCKFHRACIKDWWDTKGQPSCPTHQPYVEE